MPFDFEHWLRHTATVATAPVPKVSFVISTFNRRDVLLGTLAQLMRCGLSPDEYEIIVVDNASTDATPASVRATFPQVRLIEQSRNRGSCAKNAGIHLARAPYLVFLDDDSYPHPGSIQRMLEYFRHEARLGAAGFTVELTNGQRECSAYPQVFIGCGVGLRKRAIQEVGPLPEDFFMQAEEYDLSLRLLDAGWRISTFNDLKVTHLKSPTARSSARTTRLDVRNNLTLIARYFPRPFAWPYARDWLKRYWMLASIKGHRLAFIQGMIQGLFRATCETGRPVTPDVFETFARIEETRRRLAQAKDHHRLRRVLFVDLGKNIPAYWAAAQSCGLDVAAIADPALGDRDYSYHGIPIVSDARARRMMFDAAVISNSSPVHAARRRVQWRALENSQRPVIDLFEEVPPVAVEVEITDALGRRGSRRTVARSA